MQDRGMLAAGLIVAGLISGSAAVAQTPGSVRITNDDFLRSDRFLMGKADADILNGDIGFHWIGDGSTFYYRSQRSDGTRYLLVASATGRKNALFDHQAMAQALSAALKTTATADNLPIDRLTRVDKDRYEVVHKDKTLDCNLLARTCTEKPKVKGEPVLSPSRNGRYALFSRDYNLWLKQNDSGQERQLTRDGVRGWSYGRPPESSTGEISERRSGESQPVAALWSPDSRRFISYQLDERHVPELALVQALPEDGSFRPKLHTYHYDLVGDKPAEATFFIYDVEKNVRTPVGYRALPSSLSVPLAMSYIWWSGDGRKLYMVDSPMNKPFVKLLEVDPDTGAVRVMVEESADTTFFPNASAFGRPSIRVLSNGDVIWFSERTGWGHLYRYDGRTGKLKNAITSGDWPVRDIQYVDEREGTVYFSASGREAGEDIYNRHLYRVKLDGSGLKLLTPEPGDHDFPAVVEPEVSGLSRLGRLMAATAHVSPNGAYYIDHFSTVQAPGHWLLRRKNGSIVTRLEDEDASKLPPYTAPEPFTVKSADGKYDLYGILSKPADFDPNKHYPVIDHIYPGPQVIKAPKTFTGAILGEAQALADLGFVVIQVDGRGGTLRSKPFRDLSYRHMERAGTLEDHIAALRALAGTRPWLDLDKVGIFGSSGGGFATAHAMLDYPDFFKVGVSSAGNHEQRAYLSLWGETYHGPPDSTDYDPVFTGRNAAALKGRLLLAHGEMDDNVHPANTLRLADALIKANKQFDMLIMPNVNHGIAGTPYFRRITQNYFLKHLMGAQLPSDSDIVLPGGAPAAGKK